MCVCVCTRVCLQTFTLFFPDAFLWRFSTWTHWLSGSAVLLDSPSAVLSSELDTLFDWTVDDISESGLVSVSELSFNWPFVAGGGSTAVWLAGEVDTETAEEVVGCGVLCMCVFCTVFYTALYLYSNTQASSYRRLGKHIKSLMRCVRAGKSDHCGVFFLISSM